MGLKAATNKKTTLREKRVMLPISGEEVRLVGMNRKAQREWRQSLLGDDGQPDEKRNEMSTEILVARCAVDELGVPEVTDDEALAGEFDNLDSVDWQALTEGCFELVFGSQSQAVKDALKNLKTPGNDFSGGSSPEPDSPKGKSSSDTTTGT